MPEDTLLPFPLPAIKPKKVIAAFDGGRLSSNGGVALLALAEKRVGVIERLAKLFPDERDQDRVTHPLDSILGARIFAIGCGYEDGNDLGHLCEDPAFKLACGRLPDSGHDLCSQSTISRLENAPRLRDVIRLTSALIDQWMASYRQEPEAVVLPACSRIAAKVGPAMPALRSFAPADRDLDIDDSVDVVHGCQQLSLFNAYYDERCFLPIHVYDTERSRPVAMILRPGKTPGGVEIRSHLRRLVRRIQRHWPTTRITFRGDSHYACPEVMNWCEAKGISYIPACSRIAAKVGPAMPDLRADGPADRDIAAFSGPSRLWGISRLPSLESDKPKKRFKAYPIGSFPIDPWKDFGPKFEPRKANSPCWWPP